MTLPKSAAKQVSRAALNQLKLQLESVLKILGNIRSDISYFTSPGVRAGDVRDFPDPVVQDAIKKVYVQATASEKSMRKAKKIIDYVIRRTIASKNSEETIVSYASVADELADLMAKSLGITKEAGVLQDYKAALAKAKTEAEIDKIRKDWHARYRRPGLIVDWELHANIAKRKLKK